MTYLRESEQTLEEVGGTHELEGVAPAGFGAGPLRVLLHRLQAALEEDEHGVHDAHDQVRGLAKLPHCKNRV